MQSVLAHPLYDVRAATLKALLARSPGRCHPQSTPSTLAFPSIGGWQATLLRGLLAAKVAGLHTLKVDCIDTAQVWLDISPDNIHRGMKWCRSRAQHPIALTLQGSQQGLLICAGSQEACLLGSQAA